MTETPWNNHIHAAVRHPSDAAILMLQEGDGWRLPYYLGENLWLSWMGAINAGLSEALGTGIWGLRQFHYRRDEESRGTEMIVEAELLDPDWQLPTGARWVELGELREEGFRHPALLSSIVGYLEDLAAGRVPKVRPPWARPGWLPRAAGWIAGKLSRRGLKTTGVRAVKLWGISCVLNVETSSRDYFFKTTNRHMPLFVNEAAITKALSGFFPAAIPAPLEVDTDHDWMLLPAFDETFQGNTPTGTLCDSFQKFARLQIESIPLVDDLFEAGAIDRRLDILREMVPALLSDKKSTAKLEADDRREIRAMEPVFLALIDRLAEQAVPATLVHGDLHPGNAAVWDGEMIFFDWTDASISHPFFDLMMLSWLESERADAVKMSYLEPWEALLDPTDLEETVDLAVALLHLHHAVSYQHIVKHLEPDAQVELDFTHEFLFDALSKIREYLDKYPGVAKEIGPAAQGEDS